MLHHHVQHHWYRVPLRLHHRCYQVQALSIVTALLVCLGYIGLIVMFWVKASLAFTAMGLESEAGDTLKFTDDGFLAFFINFPFYMTIVGQGCCVLCTVCACCMIATMGMGGFQAKLGGMAGRGDYYSEGGENYKRLID